MNNRANDEMNIVRVCGVSSSYEKERRVFDGISFDITEGESVGIIGANGTGKSTLLKLLTGLHDFDGRIEVDSIEVEKKNLKEIRKKIGLVFQDADSQLFMPRVYDDVAFGPRNYNEDDAEVERLVNNALKQLEISDLKHRQTAKLSGGEKRLVCIAAVLVMNPKLILLDEPSTALDPYNRRNLIKTLKGMNQTKIIASHDLDLVLETCERVILLDEGMIKYDGDAYSALTDEKLLLSCHLELPLCMQKIIPYDKSKDE